MRTFEFRSYRSRIITLGVISLTVFFVLSNLIVGFFMFRQARIEQRQLIQTVLDTYVSFLDQLLSRYENEIAFMATDSMLNDLADCLERPLAQDAQAHDLLVTGIVERFRLFKQSHGSIRSIGFGTEQGLYFHDPEANPLPPGYDPRTRPWYALGRTLAPGRIGYTDIYQEQHGNTRAITIVRPVQGPDGQLRGVLAIILDFQELIASGMRTQIGDRGFTLVTRGDRYLIHSDPGLIGELVEAAEVRALSLARTDGSLTLWRDGDQLMAQAAYLADKDMTVWVFSYGSKMLMPFLFTLAGSFTVAVVVLLIMILIILWITKRMVREMDELGAVSVALANGRLDARASAQSSRELQILAVSFNVMADRIEKQTRALRGDLDQLNHAFRETVVTLVNAIEANDPYTRGHCTRVRDLALKSAGPAACPRSASRCSSTPACSTTSARSASRIHCCTGLAG